MYTSKDIELHCFLLLLALNFRSLEKLALHGENYIKVRNLNIDFNTGGTWHRFKQ